MGRITHTLNTNVSDGLGKSAFKSVCMLMGGEIKCVCMLMGGDGKISTVFMNENVSYNFKNLGTECGMESGL